MRNNLTAAYFDNLGMLASALCTVHCLATPLVLAFSPVLAHFLPAEESTHRAMAVMVACLGGLALLPGFRSHRRLLIPILMLLGLSCIAGAAWWGDALPAHAWEVAITCAGSALMIAAHRLNHTFCKTCVAKKQCCPTQTTVS